MCSRACETEGRNGGRKRQRKGGRKGGMEVGRTVGREGTTEEGWDENQMVESMDIVNRLKKMVRILGEGKKNMILEMVYVADV